MRGVVVDLETTGFSKSDKIMSITLIEFYGKIITDIFHTIINPMKPIPYEVFKITGLNDEMVKGFPQFYEIKKDVLKFFSNQFLFSYNSKFEERFLKQEGIKVAGIYDVLKPTRENFDLSSYKLVDVARYLGLNVQSAHTSLGDAFLCFKIVNILNERGYNWSHT